jgi:hypothetical protein
MGVGASRPLLPQKPQQIDLAQAARYFGVRGEIDARTQALLERCATPLLAAATPRAVWLRGRVDELDVLFSGEDVRKHLKGCEECILMAVTLGPAVDAQIRRAGVGDIAAGTASDALGSALVEQVCDATEQELRALFAAEGLYLTGRYSPGYGDWDIAVQPKLAQVLDTSRRMGLCVTDSFLMTPRKSVTALMGISPTPVTGFRAGCGHCKLREKCEYRKRGTSCEN